MPESGDAMNRYSPSFRAASRGPRGFTLVSVLIAASILTISLGGLVSALLHSGRLARSNRETTRAAQLARHVLETMRSYPSEDIYALYNGAPSDDPDGAGTAPGASFPLSTDGGDVYVQIEFPEGSTAGELREDVTDAALGLPHDLNGDGAIDSLNHATDYLLLPVRVRVIWTGVTGSRQFELETMLVNQ